jgi:hypothetical protein
MTAKPSKDLQMSKTHETPLRVNEFSRPKSGDKSSVRYLIEIARGCGPEGVVVLGTICCIAHYDRTDLKFLLFSLVAIWSLLGFRLLCRRRPKSERAHSTGARSPTRS